jgi:hypothetical protein
MTPQRPRPWEKDDQNLVRDCSLASRVTQATGPCVCARVAHAETSAASRYGRPSGVEDATPPDAHCGRAIRQGPDQDGPVRTVNTQA